MDFTKGLVVLLFVAIIAYLYVKYGNQSIVQPYSFIPNTLKPTLWWIVDDETNSRHWWDFGARNSHLPNKGYLKVSFECLRQTQERSFSIQPLLGRRAVSDILLSSGVRIPEKVESAPISIWRQWAAANLLAVKGGLVMMGDSTLCIGPSFYPIIQNSRACVFGIYSGEASSLPGSAMVGPSPWVSWASAPGHSGWTYAAEQWNRILNAGPTAWTAADARRDNLLIWSKQKEMGVDLFQEPEGGRNPDGSERTLEDLFGREAEPIDPKTVLLPNTVYIPFDGDALVRSYRYAWFVRMSENQIRESGFVWANLAKNISP